MLGDARRIGDSWVKETKPSWVVIKDEDWSCSKQRMDPYCPETTDALGTGKLAEEARSRRNLPGRRS